MKSLSNLILAGIQRAQKNCSSPSISILSEEDLLILLIQAISRGLPKSLHAFAKARVDGHCRRSAQLKGKLQFFDIIIGRRIIEPKARAIRKHAPGAVVRPYVADISAVLEIKLIGRWFDRVDLRDQFNRIQKDIRKLALCRSEYPKAHAGMVLFEEGLIADRGRFPVDREWTRVLEDLSKKSHVTLYHARVRAGHGLAFN